MLLLLLKSIQILPLEHLNELLTTLVKCKRMTLKGASLAPPSQILMLITIFWLLFIDVQGNDVGTQYRSGIYFYTPEQEKAAIESLERQQKVLNRKIVTEILAAKKFYRAEEYHQQYLAKGGRFGFRQSADKGCNDPIRCYG